MLHFEGFKNKYSGDRSSEAFWYLTFFLSQAKQGVIISNKNGLYDLSHELSNNVRLWN